MSLKMICPNGHLGFAPLKPVINKTGEDVVQLGVDEYGNGKVGAYNRKGKGRTLKPGP